MHTQAVCLDLRLCWKQTLAATSKSNSYRLRKAGNFRNSADIMWVTWSGNQPHQPQIRATPLPHEETLLHLWQHINRHLSSFSHREHSVCSSVDWTTLHFVGQAFGSATKPSLGMPTAQLGMPTSHSSFLECKLGGSRYWHTSLGLCHPQGRPRLTAWLLALAWLGLSFYNIWGENQGRNSLFVTAFQIKAI